VNGATVMEGWRLPVLNMELWKVCVCRAQRIDNVEDTVEFGLSVVHDKGKRCIRRSGFQLNSVKMLADMLGSSAIVEPTSDQFSKDIASLGEKCW
jgi:hypothetical protein